MTKDAIEKILDAIWVSSAVMVSHGVEKHRGEIIRQSRQELADHIGSKIKKITQHNDDYDNGYESGYNAALSELIKEIKPKEVS